MAPSAAVSGPPNLLGDNDPLVTVEEKGQDRSEEEQDGVHDAQGPRCLQHTAVLVQVQSPF